MTGDFLDMETLARHICGPWRDGRMERRLLFTCWRPDRWSDRRIERADRALIDAGHLDRIDGVCGYEVRVTESGLDQYIRRTA